MDASDSGLTVGEAPQARICSAGAYPCAAYLRHQCDCLLTRGFPHPHGVSWARQQIGARYWSDSSGYGRRADVGGVRVADLDRRS